MQTRECDICGGHKPKPCVVFMLDNHRTEGSFCCACRADSLCDHGAEAREDGMRYAIKQALIYLGNTTDPNDAAFAVAEQLREALKL